MLYIYYHFKCLHIVDLYSLPPEGFHCETGGLMIGTSDNDCDIDSGNSRTMRKCLAQALVFLE